MHVQVISFFRSTPIAENTNNNTKKIYKNNINLKITW